MRSKRVRQTAGKLDASITAEMQVTRQTAIDNFDIGGHKLKDRNGEIKGVLDEFDRALLTLVRAERPDARFHDDDPRRFDLDGNTWTTEWQQADASAMSFFRLTDDNLATELVERAKLPKLATASVAFHYDQLGPGGHLADVAQHIGAKGWLDAAKVTSPTW